MKFLSSAIIIIVFGSRAFDGIPLPKPQMLGDPLWVNMATKDLLPRHSGDPKSCPPGMWTCSALHRFDNGYFREDRDLALPGFWLLLKKTDGRRNSHKGKSHRVQAPVLSSRAYFLYTRM